MANHSDNAHQTPVLSIAPARQFTTTVAARVNFLPFVAWGYELWRVRAVSMLSGRRFPVAEELELMLEALQIGAQSTALDLGCSTGLYARTLAKSGAQTVYALDFSPAMLRVAKAKCRGLGVQFIQARAEAVPLPSESVDCVAIGGTWNEFPEPSKVAEEVYRVLKPGGRIFILFTHSSQSLLQKVFGWAGLNFPTQQEIQDQLGVGFDTHVWRENSAGFVIGTKILQNKISHSNHRRP